MKKKNMFVSLNSQPSRDNNNYDPSYKVKEMMEYMEERY